MSALSIITGGADWDRAVAGVLDPSVMLSYQYVKAAELLEPSGKAELAAFAHEGDVLLHPYIRRPIPETPGLEDITSAYEFGGFWSSARDPTVRATLMRGFAERFRGYASEQRIVSEFMRIHPFTDGVLTALAYEVKQVASHAVVQLDRPHHAIFDVYPPQLRTAIRKAERHGLRLERSSDFAPFLAIYYANLDRLGAKPYYYFAPSFFAAVQPMLELHHVVDAEGRLCAAHTYLRDGDILFSFLCHGVRERQDLRPNDFGCDQIIRQNIDNGTSRTLHLGGGQPSLLRYKAKFTPHVVPFHIATQIFDHATYSDLVDRRERNLGARVQGSPFFPLYRAHPPDPARQPERNRSSDPDS